MVTEDLIAYIQAQGRKNISKEIIISRLQNAGWHNDDIDEALDKLTPVVSKIPTASPIVSEVKITKGPDLYREIPTIDKPQEIGIKPSSDLTNKVPVQTPTYQTPQPLEKPIFATSFSEANSGGTTPSYYIPENSTVKTVPKFSEVNKSSQEPEHNLNFGVMRPKLIQVPSENMQTFSQGEQKVVSKEEFLPPLKPKIPTEPLASNINSSPNIISTHSSFEEVNIAPPKLNPIKGDSIKTTELPMMTQGKVIASKFVPASAILHSYPQVLSSSQDGGEVIFKSKRKFPFKLFFIILVLSALIGVGVAFAFDYIKIPSFNFSFIKKDPKVLLANAPQILGSLNSYKLETSATISMPSFNDITTGLMSGEASSLSKDSFSLNAKGTVNNTHPLPTFDYNIDIKSSLFDKDIISDIKYGDDKTFISTPDLSQFFGANSPSQNVVLVNKGQFNSITDLLPDSIQNKLKKVDIDKLLAIALPSYITDETTSIFKDFASSATVLEKAPENIHGSMAYHYVLSADRQASKKLLTAFSAMFLMGLSDEEKSALNETIGAMTMDTLEIWIGKEDGNIHQYKFTITVPLSKIIGLEDKGIAGNTVSLDWKTTYYDFNVANSIELPSLAINMAEFMSDMEDKKIKTLISSFKPAADVFRNSVGNFGKRSNPTGSCVNPNPSSIFSPVGHPKGANYAVGNIASLMNNILTMTNGSLTCYSTSDAWALSAPLSSDPNSSFCIDSKGSDIILTTQLKGVTCK